MNLTIIIVEEVIIIVERCNPIITCRVNIADGIVGAVGEGADGEVFFGKGVGRGKTHRHGVVPARVIVVPAQTAEVQLLKARVHVQVDRQAVGGIGQAARRVAQCVFKCALAVDNSTH